MLREPTNSPLQANHPVSLSDRRADPRILSRVEPRRHSFGWLRSERQAWAEPTGWARDKRR